MYIHNNNNNKALGPRRRNIHPMPIYMGYYTKTINKCISNFYKYEENALIYNLQWITKVSNTIHIILVKWRIIHFSGVGAVIGPSF